MAEAKVIRQEPQVVLTLTEEEATVLFMFCCAVGGGGAARRVVNSIYRALRGIRQGAVFSTFDGEQLFSNGPWLKADAEIPAGFLS